ncbi:MAG TPA: hypothetical protein VHL31_02530 [Geminicoccus sp.]|jgi:hypothetical protein|uniref:hypothetical protein n=1 Tax=Geminicoccus sp. TaxID=2024832 RepID=UPI002E35C6F6|nr:hypothetical protein [Geminicoccus sp.]HEX2525162.1 hypothetical protein [Geminicoccus sp.]
MPGRSRLRTMLAWLWRLPLVVVMALLLFEGFLRLPPFRVGVSPVTYHPALGFWHKPNYQGEAFSPCYSVPYSFDAQGLRPSRKKVTGRKAIVIGDSQIEAIMVQDDLVLHQRLQALLGDRVEVLNYGLGGSGTDLQFLVLKNLVDMDEVGWVVQLINLDSDVYEANPRQAQPGQRPRARLVFPDGNDLDHYRLIPPGPFGWGEQFRELFSSFQLYSYTRRALVPIRRALRRLRNLMAGAPAAATEARADGAEEPEESEVGQPQESAWTNLLGAVHQTRRLVEQHGGSYLPLVWYRDPLLFEEWTRRTNRLGLDSLVLPTALLADGADLAALSFPCDHHFTAATHDRIAAILAKSGLIGPP